MLKWVADVIESLASDNETVQEWLIITVDMMMVLFSRIQTLAVLTSLIISELGQDHCHGADHQDCLGNCSLLCSGEWYHLNVLK